MASFRAQVADFIKPMVPTAWRIVRAQRTVDIGSTTTIVLKQDEIKPHPTAPLNSLEVGFVITIVSPHQDIDKAENHLDDAVSTLLHALSAATWIRWETAKKVAFQDSYVAYDITAYVSQTDE